MESKIREMVAENHHQLCHLEAEMRVNKMLMVLVTLLAFLTVFLNRSQ